jgi:hypothetical protein
MWLLDFLEHFNQRWFLMQSRRGQGATEYLVILGAVLLVALVIVSLLGWFPALGASTKEQQSKSYWTSASPFAITAFKVNNTSMVISFANRLSEKVQLLNFTLGDGFGNNLEVISPNQSYAPGEEIVQSNNAYAVTNNPCYTASGTSTAGKSFEYKVVAFTYSQGSVTGIRQTGAQSLAGRCSS